MKQLRIATTTAALAGLAAVVGATSGCSGSSSAATPATHRLSGVLRLDPGHCAGRSAKPTGSYLVVISAATDKLVDNHDSRCAAKQYTLLRPGRDGGLALGRFQPAPRPAFDGRRGGTATAITRPVEFDGVRLALATDPRDEQDAPTGQPAFPAPEAIVTGDTLHVDLRSLVFLYGGRAGATCAQTYGVGCWNLGSRSATGSYDPNTGRFEVSWFQGESFSPRGDSLQVHLSGRLVPAAAPGGGS